MRFELDVPQWGKESTHMEKPCFDAADASLHVLRRNRRADRDMLLRMLAACRN
jgi:hypothetical protein